MPAARVPDQDPLGRHLRILSDDSAAAREVEVVGVVATIQDSLFAREERPHLWLPFEHRYLSNAHLHVRLRDGQAAQEALRSVRSAIRQVDERLPVLSLATMEQHLAAGFELWILRTAARLFAVFAGVALLLTVAGVYGVRAYSVARRTREIGIRTALGASLHDNQRMILKEGVRLALLGSALRVHQTGSTPVPDTTIVSPGSPIPRVIVPLLRSTLGSSATGRRERATAPARARSPGAAGSRSS